MEVLLGHKMRSLFLAGNLNNITIIIGSVPHLNFSLLGMKSEDKSYQLPVYSALKEATSVDIANEPTGQAFDCNSLLQFQDVTSLCLIGNMINLEALKELKHLERIGLHFLRDLSNMPSLKSWVNLESFIGNNIEETEGKIIKSELNNIMKVRELDYSSVSKLRKKIWFTTEYEIPFSNWEKKNEKIAVKAYKVCLKEVQKSDTEPEVKNAIFRFIERINQLHNIETSEREDVGTAVNQLIEASAVEISQQTGEMWFDEMRDF